MTAYFDSSALVKLAVVEAESAALRSWRDHSPERLSSSLLAKTELLRALRRASGGVAAGRSVLERIDLIGITPEIAERAADVGSPTLRTLDAIHLATALEIVDDLTAFVTYDRRLGAAAVSLGLRVVSPV